MKFDFYTPIFDEIGYVSLFELYLISLDLSEEEAHQRALDRKDAILDGSDDYYEF